MTDDIEKKPKNQDDLLREILKNDPGYAEELKKFKSKIAYLNHIEMTCLADVETKNQPWLWENIIPSSAFTIFAGIGGLGKSQLLMFLAAHVSNGVSFQAGGLSHKMPQGAVIVLSSEDSLSFAIAPRLQALNADLSQIHLIKSIADERTPFKRRLMALDSDLMLLRKTIDDLKRDKNQEVKLIIIDPVINFIGRVKDYINTEVSNFLYGLTELAESLDIAIILNKHLRKKDSVGASSAVDEISGSYAWATTARQVWVVARDHKDKEKIIFVNGKTNYRKNEAAMAFNIKPITFVNDKKETIKTSRIEWLGQLVNISADEAINADMHEKNKIETAKEFILSYLEENGQSVIKIINSEAVKKNITERTLRRAYGQLLDEKLVKKERGFSGHMLILTEL